MVLFISNNNNTTCLTFMSRLCCTRSPNSFYAYRGKTQRLLQRKNTSSNIFILSSKPDIAFFTATANSICFNVRLVHKTSDVMHASDDMNILSDFMST